MLDRCLESLLSVQTDCEIVVVDDGSTNEIPVVTRRHQERDERIRYVRNETRAGIPENFSVALRHARGEYVCLMGDDDQAVVGSFDLQARILDEAPSVGLVYAKWNNVDPEGRFLSTEAPGHTQHSYMGNARELFALLPGNYMNLMVVVFRRALWERYGGFDARMTVFADWDMFLRYCGRTETAFINRPLGDVAHHAATDTSLRTPTLGPAAKLAVWRGRLLEDDDLIVVGDDLWQLMFEHFRRDVAMWIGDDPARIEHWTAEAQRLREECAARGRRVFATASTTPPMGADPYANVSFVLCDDAAECHFDDVRHWAASFAGSQVVYSSKQTPSRQSLKDIPNSRCVIAGSMRGPRLWNRMVKEAQQDFLCLVRPKVRIPGEAIAGKASLLEGLRSVDFVYSKWTELGRERSTVRDPGVADCPYISDGLSTRVAVDLTGLLVSDRLALDAAMLRRDLFLRLKGFDEHLSAETSRWDLVQRCALAGGTAFVDGASTMVPESDSWSDAFEVWKKSLGRTSTVLPERTWYDLQRRAIGSIAVKAGECQQLIKTAERFAALRLRYQQQHDNQVARIVDPAGSKPAADVGAERVVMPLLDRVLVDIGREQLDDAYAVACAAHAYAPIPETSFCRAFAASKLGRHAEAAGFGGPVLAAGVDGWHERIIRRVLLDAGQALSDASLMLEALGGPIEGLRPNERVLALADAYALASDLQHQAAVLDAGLREFPQDLSIRLDFAQLLESGQLTGLAELLLRDGLSRTDRAPLLVARLSKLLTGQGRLAEALELLQLAARGGPARSS